MPLGLFVDDSITQAKKYLCDYYNFVLGSPNIEINFRTDPSCVIRNPQCIDLPSFKYSTIVVGNYEVNIPNNISTEELAHFNITDTGKMLAISNKQCYDNDK